MTHSISLKSAQDFQSAFRVEPDIAREVSAPMGVGVYGWSTPSMEGFELPGCDELVIALHVGGSQQVRAITERGPSRSRSSPGLLTILPAGRPAAFLTHGSVRLVSLHVSKDAFAHEWLQSPRFAFRDSFAGASMEALLQAAGSRKSLPSDYIDRISGALLHHLACYGKASGSPDLPHPIKHGPRGHGPLARVCAYIDANLGITLSVEDLAARAGLSRATLVRRFRRETGISPHQYIMARRVETAKALLLEGELELCFIAQDLGFASQSHFASIFRNTTGFTPSQFRRRR